MSTVTLQTRLPEDVAPFCAAMGQLYGSVTHALFVALQRGKVLTDLKREYQARFRINARQFNAMATEVQGMIRSAQECRAVQIEQLSGRIASAEKGLRALERQAAKLTRERAALRTARVTKYRANKHGQRQPCLRADETLAAVVRAEANKIDFNLHQQRRRLETLRLRLAHLEQSPLSVAFGRKKLWHAQFTLEENGYADHRTWLAEWQERRSSQFFLLGSGDETVGCQVCQLRPEGTLRVRVPDALANEYRQYVEIPGIRFAYGQEIVDAALALHAQPRARVAGEKRDTHAHGKPALSYRFLRKDGVWYVHLSTERVDPPIISRRVRGALGVGLNADTVAWAACDGEGNLARHGLIRTPVRDRSEQRIAATYGDACVRIVAAAQALGVPVVCEKLDFSKRKQELHERGRRYSRMLSSFAYSRFAGMLASACARSGVELVRVKPPYSRVIGLVKFLNISGLESGGAAALVLARRALGLSERLPDCVTLRVPVDSGRHMWCHWARFKREHTAALRTRHVFFRSKRRPNRAGEVTLDVGGLAAPAGPGYQASGVAV